MRVTCDSDRLAELSLWCVVRSSNDPQEVAPGVEDLDTVVVGVRNDEVVVLGSTDLPGVHELALSLALTSDGPDELTLGREDTETVVAGVDDVQESWERKWVSTEIFQKINGQHYL